MSEQNISYKQAAEIYFNAVSQTVPEANDFPVLPDPKLIFPKLKSHIGETPRP